VQDQEDSMPLKEKDVLKLLVDGPTLQQLTNSISEELRKRISPPAVGEVLVALQDKEYVFLEEGRWWRTPEGVSYLDKLLADELVDQEAHAKETRYGRLSVLAGMLTQGSNDLIFALVLSFAVLLLKLSYAFGYLVPGWDSTVYLLNARRFLYGWDPFSFFELLRPPLLPNIVSELWKVFGETYWITMSIQPIFTVAAGLVLYLVVREMFDWKTAMLSLFMFLFNPTVFKWTNQLLTHGVELFFVLLSIFFAWRTYSESATRDLLPKYVYPALVGSLAGLASLARYPALMFLPAVLVLVLRREIVWNVRWIMICGLGFILPWSYWLRWNMTYANGDAFASVKAAFQVGAFRGPAEVQTAVDPWHIYITGLPQLITVVGVALLLAGILSKENFRNKKTLVFLSWFAIATGVGFVLENKAVRFMTDWFPAISVLMALGIARIQKKLNFRPKAAFNILIAAWLIYLVWSTTVLATADLNESNGSPQKEFPTVVSWVTTNMAKTDIGVSDLYTPQLNYFAKRLFYSYDYVREVSMVRGITIQEAMAQLSVTYVIATPSLIEHYNLDKTSYLMMHKKFENFVVYAFVRTG